MTMIVPDYKRCPHCEEILMSMEVMSHNTFGTTFWTDGRAYDALKSHHQMMKCPECSAFFWKRDMIELGKEERKKSKYDKEIEDMIKKINNDKTSYEDNGELVEYERVNPIELSEMYSFLGSKEVRNKEEERYVRKMIWWHSNDLRRINKNNDNNVTYSEEEIKNMERLLELESDDAIENTLVKAEIKRYFGEFESSMLLLDEIKDERLKGVISVMRKANEKGERMVKMID